MAADAADGGGSGNEPYIWVRCECGAGLWRRYADRLEMTVIPRAGRRAPRDETGAIRKRTITVGVHAVPGLTVKCEKCGKVNASA